MRKRRGRACRRPAPSKFARSARQGERLMRASRTGQNRCVRIEKLRQGPHLRRARPTSRHSTRTSMLTLAARMSRAKPSAIMIVADKAKQLKAAGRDIISFSIGVPNFLPGAARLRRGARSARARTAASTARTAAPTRCSMRSSSICEEGGLDRLQAQEHRDRRSAPSTCCTTSPKRCSIAGDTIAFAVPYWTTLRRHRRHPRREDAPAAVPGEPELQADAGAARRGVAGRRRCSCSTIRAIRPAWSTRRTRSRRSPTCW